MGGTLVEKQVWGRNDSLIKREEEMEVCREK